MVVEWGGAVGVVGWAQEHPGHQPPLPDYSRGPIKRNAPRRRQHASDEGRLRDLDREAAALHHRPGTAKSERLWGGGGGISEGEGDRLP